MEEIYKAINAITDAETRTLVKYMFKEFFNAEDAKKMYYLHGSIVGACTVAINFGHFNKEDLFFLNEYLNDLIVLRLKHKKHK